MLWIVILFVFIFTALVTYTVITRLNIQTINSTDLFSTDYLNQKNDSRISHNLFTNKYLQLIHWIKLKRLMVGLFITVTILLFVQQYIVAILLLVLWIIYKSKEKQKRINGIIQELPNSIVMMSRSLKAGLTLEKTLENLTKYSPNKSIREIFSSVLYRSRVSGRPIGVVASELVESYDIAQLSLLMSVLDTHTKSGGNFIVALEMLESQFRQMYLSKKKVDTLLSESKMSLYVLASIPLIVGGAVYYLNPNHFSIFLTPEGRNGVYYVVGFYLFGLGLGKFLIRS